MRKAQAALEFLTTYGWAFLVILIMIGALAYFGVLNPSKLLPSRCTLSPEVVCVEHRITTAGGLEFRIRNNVGSTADFTFNATDISSNENIGCTVSSGEAIATQLRPGRIANVTCSGFTRTLPVGDKVKLEITGTYQKSGGAYWIPISGEVYSEVQ